MLALTERKERNERSLAQAVRLGDFFREPFIDGMFSWKKPISERFSKEEAEEKLLECITEIEKEEVEDETIARLLKRCKKYNSMLFTYLQQEGMPPDNNRAERGLRKFSRQRKISGDFKSEDVLRNYAMYLSLFMTCEANDIDFDAILVGILTGESVDMRHLLLP